MPYPSYFAREEVSSQDQSFVDFSKPYKDFPHPSPYMVRSRTLLSNFSHSGKEM